MAFVNENFLKLQKSYLFVEIAKRVEEFQKENPDIEIIKMGIGDVTLPLPQVCIDAMKKAVEELGDPATFRGYGPEQGYEFLREKIARYDFNNRGIDISKDEIFVSDGAKCDTGNFQELFSNDAKVAIPDPVYPVYLDTNVMAGRSGDLIDGRYSNIKYLDCTYENNFIPDLPDEKVDLIYLCFPNNPTGATITKEHLKKWIDYARENKAIILYDAAYEAFITDPNIPHSIYEVEGAKEVAVEFRSFSKTAGFTGVRCAYTVVPKECFGYTKDGEKISVHDLWLRRQSTKFNGVSYIVQRGAEAIYSEEGKNQVKELVDYYLENAKIIKSAMKEAGFICVGGDNSPYVWVKADMSSWDLFDLILKKCGVVCTPGSGFGRCGEGYIRLSAFNFKENVEKAMERIKNAKLK